MQCSHDITTTSLELLGHDPTANLRQASRWGKSKKKKAPQTYIRTYMHMYIKCSYFPLLRLIRPRGGGRDMHSLGSLAQASPVTATRQGFRLWRRAATGEGGRKRTWERKATKPNSARPAALGRPTQYKKCMRVCVFPGGMGGGHLHIANLLHTYVTTT
jgi:hypothetical protein